MPGGRHYGPGEEAIIRKVYSFFVDEYRCPRRRIGMQHVLKRTSKATGVSVRTLSRIIGRSDKATAASAPEARGRRAVVVDEFARSVVRSKVFSFYSKNGSIQL